MSDDKSGPDLIVIAGGKDRPSRPVRRTVPHIIAIT